MVRLLLIVAALWFVPGTGFAQDGNQPGDADSVAAISDPAVLLGRRALAALEGVPRGDVVVIVDSPENAAAAIDLWTSDVRFPVLIDDGRAASARAIGRFVRSYAPSRVVRWSPAETRATPDAADFDAARQRLGVETPGVVVTMAGDPALIAAYALATGRGQRAAFVDVRSRRVGGAMDASEASEFGAAIESALSEMDVAYDAIGDDVDALTLCTNVASRVRDDADGPLALTDVVGRSSGGGGVRWAWCGLVFGEESDALMMAMCSMFLPVDEAWLMDGYDAGFAPPYALNEAREYFEKVGMEIVFDENASPLTLRGRARQGVSADVIMVNSKGHAEWFDLGADRAYASDIPMLLEPAAVYFIHSFSAQRLHDRTTIARRWIDHGAYVYAGSVDEPKLGAFLPGSAVTARLLTGGAFGAAVRAPGRPAWKINVLGDPLTVLTRRPDAWKPVDASAWGGDVSDVNDRMAAAAKAERVADVLEALTILGRDDDAVTVARAAVKDRVDELDDRALELALPALARGGHVDDFNDAYVRLGEDASDDPVLVDLLWRVNRERMGGADEEALALLRAHIRDASMAEDAAALAPGLERLYGRGVVDGMYADLIQRAPNQRVKRDLMRR